MILNINTDATVWFTNQLEQINRSALPVAIRTALNSTAFDVKKRTMPALAKAKFINRSPNFFKANSRVEMAKGFHIREMEATVGFIDARLKGSNNFAVKDLDQQEHGGNIGGRKFIPLRGARSGKNDNKLVSPKNRISAIKKLYNAGNARGKNDKEKFVRTAIHAGAGGHILSNYKGKRYIWRVDTLKRTMGKWKFKLTPLYVENTDKKVDVQSTGFMKTASTLSAKKMERFFQMAAVKKIQQFRKG